MEVITDIKRIHEIFERGIVREVLPSLDALYELFTSGRRLKIYIGVDPTSTSLHLSHAKNYMFLEELRLLGHEVIVLFGDFTARIGDPSERSEARKQLTSQQTNENVQEWLRQIKPLMDFSASDNPPKIAHNSTWLAPLVFEDILSLASNFTVQQMLERDMFQKKIKQDKPIYLHEFMYPLMQGYDSVALDVDIELCGGDQIFNALVGRTLVKRFKDKEKFVIALNLMENPVTGELMSKSKGIGVFLSSPPAEMFGEIMSQPDEMIEVFYINNTRLPLSDKEKFLSVGPRRAKADIAFEIVKSMYGENTAKEASEEFEKVFARGALPEEMQTFAVRGNARDLRETLKASGMVSSKSEAQRLIEQGGVSVNGAAVRDWNVDHCAGDVIKVGPRRFLKIV